MSRTLRLTLVILAASISGSCASNVVQQTETDRPNVLWVIWDTVRADRLGIYGYEKPTTPFLQEWARGARVFEDCISTAGSTVPSHASMFTGLLPTEHGAFHTQRMLDTGLTTIAELFREQGYQTYLFAANPHLQKRQNFDQGFDVNEHPWDDDYREEAERIVSGKVATEDRSSHLADKVRAGKELSPWNIKAAGELAQKGLTRWLDGRDRDRPWFAFLNYMEAHAPYIPPRSFRERTLSPEQVDRSYRIDNAPAARWAYTFGLREYSASDLEILGGTYDATLLELDELFRSLITDLEARGDLDNTIVVLASDHGEHLGEHRMLDHQYALYEQLLRVPLIVHYPRKIEPGRDRSPVETFDIFPTLLELAEIDPPPGLKSQAVSLLSPQSSRYRLAEYPAAFEPGIRTIAGMYPDWDSSPWQRRLRALYHGEHKFICATDGRHELFDVRADPGESNDLHASRADVADDLMQGLLELAATLTPARSVPEAPPLSKEQQSMLEALGYVGDSEPDEEELPGQPANAASCGFAD